MAGSPGGTWPSCTRRPERPLAREPGVQQTAGMWRAFPILLFLCCLPMVPVAQADGRAANSRLGLWPGQPGGVTGPGIAFQPWAGIRLWGSDPPRQFLLPHLDPREAAVDDAVAVELGFELDLSLLPSLSAHADFRFDSSPAGDPWRRTREFDPLGAANNLDQAWLQYSARWGQLVLGRKALDWGLPRGDGLALSGHAPPMDLALARIEMGPHWLGAFAGQLSDGAGGQLRYLYGHRVQLRLGACSVGLSEFAVVADEGLQLRWLNPMNFYAQVQAEGDGAAGPRSNVLHSIDLGWKVSQRLSLYGEFAVDDLQLDREARREKPDQLAWRAGGILQPPVGHELGYEYRRVGSWTYVHKGEGTNWQSFGVPLGAAEGPDGDMHKLWWHSRLPAEIQAQLELRLRRRGGVRIDSDEDPRGHAGEAFPSAPAEDWQQAFLELRRPFTRRVQATLGVAWHSIDRDGQTREEVREGWLALRIEGTTWGWLDEGAW